MGTYLYDTVSRYLPFVRKRKALDRGDALKMIPVRNPVLEWEKGDEGEVKLRIPARNDGIWKYVGKVFRAPAYHVIEMDEVGSHVWELCNGKNSIDSIVVKMCDKYRITRRECEVSVTTYLKTLMDRKLIGVQVGGRHKK